MASGRVVGIVALCVVAAVAAVVGGTLLLSRHESTTPRDAVTKPRHGRPVLQLELGLRRDPEAVALETADNLLDAKKPAAAARIFARYDSVEARLGLAFAQWKGPESLGAVKAIAASDPQSAAALFNLGSADFQAGRNLDAVNAWERTASQFPDSPYAVDALDALHPKVFPALPYIVVDTNAVSGEARADLRAGIHLWDLKETVSARSALDAAAKLAPGSPETLVAAAVAQFSPTDPKAPFAQLGPLTAQFPHASIVRLHLGLVLLWNEEVTKGTTQLRIAAAEQPGSIYAKRARQLLDALGHANGE